MNEVGALILGGVATVFSAIMFIYSLIKCSIDNKLLDYIIAIGSLVTFIFMINNLWDCM